jgi:hypothetical protein
VCDDIIINFVVYCFFVLLHIANQRHVLGEDDADWHLSLYFMMV